MAQNIGLKFTQLPMSFGAKHE
ncbi:small protein YadW [Citrobacter sp. Marseille-Q6884]